jgi:hypothetical protein
VGSATTGDAPSCPATGGASCPTGSGFS